MAHLRFGPKFLLLGALFGLPIAILLATYLGEVQDRIASARSEREGLRYAAACTRAIRAIQILRGTTNLARGLAGREGASPALELSLRDAEVAAEARMAELRAIERVSEGGLGTSATARGEFVRWRSLRANAASLEARPLFEAYSARIAGLNALLQEVGEGSRPAPASTLDSHYMAVLLIKRTMPAIETLARIRGRHVGEIARREPVVDAERRADWRAFDDRIALTERALGVAERANPSLDPHLRLRYEEIRRESGRLRALSELPEGAPLAAALGVRRDPGEEASALFGAYTGVLDRLYDLGALAQGEADRIIGARDAATVRARDRILVATGAALTLAVYLCAGLYRSLRHLVSGLEASAAAMERGETRPALDVHSQDELARVAVSFNRVFRRLIDMNDGLNDLVLERTAELTSRNLELHETALVLQERGRALECALDAVARVDVAGRIEGLNPAFGAIFGGDARDRLGQDWLAAFDPRSHTALREALAGLADAPGGAAELRVHGLRQGFGLFAADVHLVACADDRGRSTGHYLLVQDVSERVAYEERIRHLAYHDPLTGLPNRVSFGDSLRAALASPGPLAVMFLDLDGFKGVNDRFGHEAGDAVLRVVAERLRRALADAPGGEGAVARLAGDEFAVLLAPAPAPEDARRLGLALIAAIDRPIELPRGVARVSASIGVAFREGSRETFDTLLHRADAAMYRGKAEGKATCVVAVPARAA